MYIDDLGIDICAAAQLFTCSEGNWCNLLTPTEYYYALSLSELPIVDTEAVVGAAYKRASCDYSCGCDSSSDSSDSSSSDSSSSESECDSDSEEYHHHRDHHSGHHHGGHRDHHRSRRLEERPNYQMLGHKSKPKSKSSGGDCDSKSSHHSDGDCDSKSSHHSDGDCDYQPGSKEHNDGGCYYRRELSP